MLNDTVMRNIDFSSRKMLSDSSHREKARDMRIHTTTYRYCDLIIAN